MIEIGGFVGLAALVIGLFAWTRADVRYSRAESKSDIGRLEGGFANLRTDVKADVGRLEGSIADLRTELRGDIADLRTELKGDIAALREGQTELREGQAELRERMAKLEGLLDGLREAVTWRAGPRDAA